MVPNGWKKIHRGRPKIFFLKILFNKKISGLSIQNFIWMISIVIRPDFLNKTLISGLLCANPLDFGGNKSKAWITTPPRYSGLPTALQCMSVCVWYCETLYVSTKGQVPWVKILTWKMLLHLGQTFVKFVLILKRTPRAISVCLTKIGLNTIEYLPKQSKLKEHDLGI